MKQKHRRAHVLIWIILLPLMLFISYHALQSRLSIEDEYGPSDVPTTNGERLL